jgi:hypothetical protein
MMTPRKFSLLALGIPLSVILLVGVTNFVVDGDSSHHLPTDRSVIPRTTNHSALSKLHFIYEQRPEVMYFGSSRVEVGLPVEPELFKGRSVYNSALSANTLGNTLPLIMHVLGGYSPKVIVLGVDFMSFTPKPSPESNLDMSLLSSDFSGYRTKRLWYDVKRAVTVDASGHSITALRALYTQRPYDPLDGVGSIAGQTSEKEMLRLTAVRGQYVTAFQRTLKYADSMPPSPAEINGGMKMFEDFIVAACSRKITVRVFTNPRHALAEYMMAKNGHWPEVERWKVALADIASRNAASCDLKIVDFAGFNSVTAESIDSMTPAQGLANYWEASHFKDKVGKLILKRMFAPDASVPADFGRELTIDTVAQVNSLVERERQVFLRSRAREIPLAHAWLAVDTSH